MTPCISPFAMLLAAFVFYGTGAAQAGTRLHSGRLPSHTRSSANYPAPSNLKVLSRNLTARQVDDIMRQWSAELGVRCGACHLRNSEAIASPSPRDDRFADDSKPMKLAARIMYTMTTEINRKFITSDDGAPGPVTCGTCHRGSIRPQPFASPANAQPVDDEAASQ